MEANRVGGAIVAALVVLAGLALSPADVHGQGNMVHSCVNSSSGIIRLVAPDVRCRENETAVNWPATAGGGLRIVDSTGQVIGPLVLSNSAPVEIGGSLSLVALTPSGFMDGPLPPFLHENSDCTGKQYLGASSLSFFKPIYQAAGIGYYPQEPYQLRTVYAGIPPFLCFPTTSLVGEVGTIDLSSLGFVPPFHVE